MSVDRRWKTCLLVFAACGSIPARAADESFPVAIRVDAGQSVGAMRPVWRYFGFDEPNYATMKDGKELLGRLAHLGDEPILIRTHNLLTSGDGTAALKWGSTGVYSEDAQGNPVYNWTIIDQIFDTYKAQHVRPFVQIGFMPEALSIHPQPYQHQWTPGGKASISTGWAYPPKDYAKWGELVHQWAKHLDERYGRGEVETWKWEVWNEPNILYWRGTPQEYHKLYDFAVDGVKRAIPTARVGGPHVAGTRTPESQKFLREFLDHCLRGQNFATGKTGAPLDFVAFHAKGSPRFVDGHVQTGIASQLQDINTGFAIVASEPALKNTPIIIGESDPDGCAACPSSLYPQNGYRNGSLYASYTAASFARKYMLADKNGVNFEGAVTWAFEFEDQPSFAGFRVLSSNGVPLPVFNVFRMFAQMGGQRVATTSTGDLGLQTLMRSGAKTPDVAALASFQDGKLAVMVWHHDDRDLPGPSADIDLTIAGLPSKSLRITQYRVDGDHGNAFTAWQKMGSPPRPSNDQKATLLKASNLATITKSRPVAIEPDGSTKVQITLPRQGVSLLVFEEQP